MKNDLSGLETILFSILLPIMSVFGSICMNYLESNIGFINTLIALIIVCLIVGISYYVGITVFFAVSKKTLELKIDLEIKGIQEKIANGKIMNGVCKEEQLAMMEKTCIFDEIWLISPDLLTEINDGIYAGVIKQNLKKGTRYKYFVPDTEINQVRVKIFEESCSRSKNLEIHFLADDFFFLVPKVDFAIYEPMKSISNGKKGYMGLPIQGEKERFAILMNNDFVDAVVGKLAECLKNK